MKRIFFAIMLVTVCALTAMAQNRTLRGTIIDKETKEPVMQTTVQLLKSDSTFVAGAASDEDGKFSVSAPQNGKYILKISNIGYTTKYQNLTVENDKDYDFGTVSLATDAVMLKEVIAQGVAAKVTVKEDTFVYNAAAYRVPEGSVIEELVKKLPGAQVDDDGTIKINGKTVKKIKVDGKEFMTGDTKTAMKNLPTSIVERVKAYDEKSDLARITGIDDGDESTVLDFGIKRGMNRGTMINSDFGYGNKERYSARVMGGHMKEDLRIFGFINGNNTGDMGFPGGGGGGRFRGGNNGLNASKMGALQFNYEGDKLAGDGSVRWNHRDGDAFSRSSTESFVTKTGSFGNSQNNNLSRSDQLNFQARLEWKPDTMTNIMFRPSYSYNVNDGLSGSLSGTYDEDPYLYTTDPLANKYITNAAGKFINVNASQSKSMSYSDSKNANGMLQFNRKLNSKGRNFTLRVDGGLSEGMSNNISLQELLSRSGDYVVGVTPQGEYYRTTLTNRYDATPTKNHNYTLQGTYSEPIFKNTFLQLRYQYQYSYRKSDRNSYNLSGINGLINSPLDYRCWEDFLNNNVFSPFGTKLEDYLDPAQSRFSEYTTYTHVVELMMRMIRTNYNLNLGVQIQPQRTHFVQDYQNVKADTIRNVTNITPTIDFRYRFSKVSQLRINYRANTSQPSMSDLLNIVDDSRPQNISMGNPGLKPSFNNNLRINYDGYRQFHMQSWMASLNFSTTQNSISNKVTYFEEETKVKIKDGVVVPSTDPNYSSFKANEYLLPAGGRISRPENINGNWNIGGDAMFNTSIDTTGVWNFNTYASVNYSNHVGYLSLGGTSEKNTTKDLSISDRLSFSYRNDWIEIEPNGNVMFSRMRNDLQPNNNRDTWNFNYGLNLNLTAPWGMQFSTDWHMNSRRGYDDPSMNTNEGVWNAQISQSFLKGNALTVMLQFYDILHEQSNFSRSISAMQRSDTWYNTINSYVMLHVSFRFFSFGGKMPSFGGGRNGRNGRPDGPGMSGRGGYGGGGFGGGRPGGGFGGGGRF